MYKPIMRNENKGIKGIFKMDDELIKYLVENGETV